MHNEVARSGKSLSLESGKCRDVVAIQEVQRECLAGTRRLAVLLRQPNWEVMEVNSSNDRFWSEKKAFELRWKCIEGVLWKLTAQSLRRNQCLLALEPISSKWEITSYRPPLLISQSVHAVNALSLAARSRGFRSDAPMPLSSIAEYWYFTLHL